MNSYKPVFEECIRRAESITEFEKIYNVYPRFREREDLFHFIMACGTWKYFSDAEAIELALQINPELADFLVKIGPSRAGGGLPTIDVIESRHILLLTWLFNNLNQNWSDKKIVEFGGGYGNFVRLAYQLVNPKEWNIVDLKYISSLQRWFLQQENVNTTSINLITTDEYKPIEAPWLSIGTHSLSEMDINTFKFYFNTTIRYSKYLFYACHNIKPSVELINEKFTIINDVFKLVSMQSYEEHNCTMYLFEQKST